NPVPAAYVKENAAVGAISYALKLGEAMLAAKDDGPEAVIQAAARETKGQIIGRGKVRNAKVDTRDSWDFAKFEIEDEKGILTLHTMNEYMAVDLDGERISTFPDLISTLSLDTGLPVSVAQMKEGQKIAVLINNKKDLPLGMGAKQPDAYHEVEQHMGIDLLSYALK
ncbi:MAG TPA: hypothetical protein V6C72_12420, partial [Chroococcales cyanobacterium]